MYEELDRLRLFDIDEGLQRIGGSREFMVELLNHFIRDFARSRDEYVRLMGQGDLEAATRLIHSVKGAAGNLAAKQLQGAAAALESALNRKSLAEAEEHVFHFDSCLKDVLEDLRSSGVRDLSGDKEDREAGDEALLLRLLAQFSAYAGAGKVVEAKKKCRELDLYVWPDRAGDAVAAISQLMKQYRMNEAATEAETLYQTLSRELL